MSVDKKSSYYDAGGIEVIGIIRAKLTPEQYVGFLLGNVIKYATRLMHKGTPERDAEKVQVYSKLLESDITMTSLLTDLSDITTGHAIEEGDTRVIHYDREPDVPYYEMWHPDRGWFSISTTDWEKKNV